MTRLCQIVYFTISIRLVRGNAHTDFAALPVNRVGYRDLASGDKS
jgi:hypothetical protein